MKLEHKVLNFAFSYIFERNFLNTKWHHQFVRKYAFQPINSSKTHNAFSLYFHIHIPNFFIYMSWKWKIPKISESLYFALWKFCVNKVAMSVATGVCKMHEKEPLQFIIFSQKKRLKSRLGIKPSAINFGKYFSKCRQFWQIIKVPSQEFHFEMGLKLEIKKSEPASFRH